MSDEPVKPEPPTWTDGTPVEPPFGGKWDPFGPDDDPNPARCPSCGVQYTIHIGLNGTCQRLIEMTAERDRLSQYVETLLKSVDTLEPIINSNKD
jgi:hypothetical protein